MIDYIRPVAIATAAAEAAPCEVIFQSGEQKHKLSYVNGTERHAYFRPCDRVNGNPLLNALEVILYGLPNDVRQVNVRAESDACRDALKRECNGCSDATIIDKLSAQPVARKITFHI